LGAWFPERGWGLAGVLVLSLLLLTGLPVQGGLASGGTSWAAAYPDLAAFLLECSPLVLVYDCAGWDWVHGHPEAYALSGVEWFPRTPYRGSLAGPAVLLVGCVFAVLGSRLARTRGASTQTT
jgi:hypothetical protein